MLTHGCSTHFVPMPEERTQSHNLSLEGFSHRPTHMTPSNVASTEYRCITSWYYHMLYQFSTKQKPWLWQIILPCIIFVDDDCNIILTVQIAFSLNKCNFSLLPLSMYQVYFRGFSHRTEMKTCQIKAWHHTMLKNGSGLLFINSWVCFGVFFALILHRHLNNKLLHEWLTSSITSCCSTSIYPLAKSWTRNIGEQHCFQDSIACWLKRSLTVRHDVKPLSKEVPLQEHTWAVVWWKWKALMGFRQRCPQTTSGWHNQLP